MSSVMGHISIFDHNTQDWQIFLGRLEQFIKLNKIADDNKGALLLTHLSDETYRLAQNLVHPKNIVDVEFDGLVKELSGHFTPKRCTFADRAKFYEATRASGESVESWAARLRGLAVHCEFGSALELLLRDRFVLGMNAGPERDRLFETDATTVTFGKALEVAQQAACARQARQHLAPPPHVKEEPVYRVGDDRDVHRCQVCGLKGHEADKCRFKKYKCKQCGAKGHLKKVCAVKKCANRLNNLCAVESSDDAEGKSDGHICKECEVFNLRIKEFGALMQQNKLCPLQGAGANGKARARLQRHTTYWPLTISSTLIFNLGSVMEPLTRLVVQENLTDEEVDTCRAVLLNLLAMESRHEFPNAQNTSNARSKSSSRREEQWRQVWGELQALVRAHSASAGHRALLRTALECRAHSQPSDSESRASVIRATTDSPLSPTGAGNGSTTTSDVWAPRNILDTLLGAPRPSRRPDFAGRMAAGGRVATLYPNLQKDVEGSH